MLNCQLVGTLAFCPALTRSTYYIGAIMADLETFSKKSLSEPIFWASKVFIQSKKDKVDLSNKQAQ